MFTSFSSALSALKAHSTAVDAVGHNLANVNTTAFKGTEVAFKDIVSAAIGQGETGMGVDRLITVRNFAQGSIQTTSGSLDAAIQGSGFFVVKDASGATLMTRDGSFQLDKKGYVVTLTGERVQQYTAQGLADIQIPTAATQATETKSMNVTANLDASAPVGATLMSPVEVVDSLGVTHVVTIIYSKIAPNQWSVDATLPDNEIGGTTPDLKSLFQSPLPAENIIEFDKTGNLTTPEAPGALTISIATLSDKAADMAITLDFHDAAGVGLVTQFAQPSAVSKTLQDGITAAEITGIGMADGGQILARYRNGQELAVASLAIALITNPASLQGAGNNLFRTSGDSAAPTFSTAAKGGRGAVKAGSLEASTVDMAREFTNLILYQRGYQANSRVITTADEMSQETLSIKR